MFSHRKNLWIAGSVALNVAFVGMWLAIAIPAHLQSSEVASPPAAPGEVWCPLHQKLGVTEEQWRRIEPRLKEFRQSAELACGRVAEIRLEMLELIAAPDADAQAIAAKQEELLAAQSQMQGLVIGQLLAEKEVLSPEQEARLFEMIRTQSGCDRAGPMLMHGQGRGVGRFLRGAPGD